MATAETQRRGEGAELVLGELSEAVIGAAIEVHRALGPGLLESSYRECLLHELSLRGIPCRKEVALPVEYKGIKLQCGYRLDLLVADQLVLELKVVEKVTDVHRAQLLTYLRLGNYPLRLILNFHEVVLKNGIHRLVQSSSRKNF